MPRDSIDQSTSAPTPRRRPDPLDAEASPLKEAATATGSLYSEPHVRDLFYQARRRGLLTHPPAKGIPGGELIEKGKKALERSVES